MEDILNKKGKFWVVGDEETKFDATLDYDSDYILKTDLDSSLAEKFNEMIIFVGEIDGIPVTLYKSSLSAWYGNLEFMVQYIFKNYDHCNSVSFKNVQFQFDKLNKWISDSAHVINMDKMEICVELQNKQIVLDDFTINLLFDDILNKSTKSPSINFNISYDYNESKDFLDILKDIKILKNFFIFAIYSNINLKELKILLRQDESVQEITVFSKYFTTGSMGYNWYSMLMQYFEIEDSIETIIKNWFNSYFKFKPFFDIYFLNIESNLYAEALLITYVEALEYFMSHNELYDDKFMKSEEYESIFNRFEEFIESLDITDDHKESLKGAVKHGYSYNLRKRLKNLFKKLDKYEVTRELVREYGKPKDFINIVVFTRNYYTHYGDKNKFVKSGGELLLLDFTLRLILDLSLLNELGLSEEYINKILRKKLEYFPKLLE